MSRTKIVCTLGPATDSEDTLRQLIEAGARVVRLNFSHGTHEDQEWRLRTVRRLTDEMDIFVGVMVDLQGPKLRIGLIENGPVTLEEGARFVLTSRDAPGNAQEVHFGYPDAISRVEPGVRVLLDDGLIELRAERVEDTDLITEVVVGGELSSRKGVTLPDTELQLASLTDKDREDARFAASLGVDFFALSFVRSARNVEDLRQYLKEVGAEDTPIIAKIEKKKGIERFSEILHVSDAIMVARGDLGVEVPPEDVPIHQKALVKECNAAGKPVIIATQMLQSMMDNPRPTRAEASDVANAIWDGADAIMLSGETAVGRYPVGAVKMMAKIARVAEEHYPYAAHLNAAVSNRAYTVTDAISQATCEIAHELRVKAVIASTRSGHTARMVAKYRPATPLFAPTPEPAVASRLTLVWGVTPILVEQFDSTDEMIQNAIQAVKARQAVREGDLVVITAGVPTAGAGRTNMVQVHAVE